jgi:hypothetical protein
MNREPRPSIARARPAAPGALFLFLAIGLCAPVPARADPATPPAQANRVVVAYYHPETFDINVRRMDAPFEERDRRHTLGVIGDYVIERALGYLPEGYHFYVRFTNVVLAGRFAPGQAAGPRHVSPITPPIFEFEWSVTDRAGNVVKRGTESLVDRNFRLEGASTSIADYSFEKAALDAWMRANLRG